MAGSDDAGDVKTSQDYLAAANSNTPQALDQPVSTPTDLGNFYG